MGKAVVYNYLGEGKYSILYKRDNSRAKQRLAELEDLKKELDGTYYNDMLPIRTKAEINYNAASQKFFWAIDDWAACAKLLPPCKDHAALMGAVKDRAKERSAAAFALSVIRGHIAKNRADHHAAQTEQAYLDSTAQTYADGQVIDAWCISLDPENIIPNGTTVGTIETYGAIGDDQGGFLPKKYINIASTDAPAYSCAEHNRVQPASSMGTASWFNAYCQWLHAMSQNPKFAVGTVTGKAGGALSVALYGATPAGSQPKGYPFGDTAGYAVNLVNVPVDYLDCGAGPFEVDDRVIVRFGGIGRASPVVIGFAESPKECLSLQVVYEISPAYAGTIVGEAVQKVAPYGDATPVSVTAFAGYSFLGWSDGFMELSRHDKNISEPLYLVADMQYVGSVQWPASVAGRISGWPSDGTCAEVVFSSGITPPPWVYDDVGCDWFTKVPTLWDNRVQRVYMGYVYGSNPVIQIWAWQWKDEPSHNAAKADAIEFFGLAGKELIINISGESRPYVFSHIESISVPQWFDPPGEPPNPNGQMSIVMWFVPGN
jgi:hypothetical protein